MRTLFSLIEAAGIASAGDNLATNWVQHRDGVGWHLIETSFGMILPCLPLPISIRPVGSDHGGAPRRKAVGLFRAFVRDAMMPS
jgi:hypothetical protein